MAKQWIRQASLIIGAGTDALDLSDLHFRFHVRQMDLQTPNGAEIRIYNVSDETAKRARQYLVEGGEVWLQAGYDGNFGTIFRGNVIQVRVGRESPVDTYLDITAGDGDFAYGFAQMRRTFAAGSSVKDHVNAALEAMGPYGVTRGWIPDDLPDTPLPRGKVMFGPARKHLETAGRTGDFDWSILNGKLNTVPTRAYLPGDAVVVTSATGMIGVPEQQLDGIHVRTLLNPSIAARRVLQLSNKSIQEFRLPLNLPGSVVDGFVPKLDWDGYYVALVVNHEGDTRGETWYSDVTAIGVSEPIPTPLLSRLVIPPGV